LLLLAKPANAVRLNAIKSIVAVLVVGWLALLSADVSPAAIASPNLPQRW